MSMPWKAGTIKSIKLVNFMCHSSFEVEFGSHVNFIIGPNGSGKSALLTALVIALGGRATVTGRAKKLEEFIKYDEQSARVTVVLHNYEKAFDKNQAFKPDDYGKFIIIEKTIIRQGAARLTIRNDKKQIVSERSSELLELLEHFNIQINNPICVLNQEVSKTFLHSKNPEDKFALFMKATTIERIEDDYNKSHLMFGSWQETNENHQVSYALLENEYKSCDEKIKFLERRAKIDDDVARLQLLLIWAKIRDGETVVKEMTDKIKKHSTSIQSLQEKVEDRESKISSYESEIELYKSKQQEKRTYASEIRAKLDTVKRQEADLKIEKANLAMQISSSKRKCSEYDVQQKEIRDKIEQIHKKIRQKDSDAESQKRSLERLGTEIPHLKAREITMRQHTDQLMASVERLVSDLREAETDKNMKFRLVSGLEAELRRLANKKKDYLLAFGSHMEELLNEIDKEQSFVRKPVGPLGFHIKMKEQDAAVALEAALGGGAMAFACDNKRDMGVLKRIFKVLSNRHSDFRHPVIVTRDFGSKHDVNQFKSTHSTYKSLIDCVTIENSSVFNAIVDKYGIETILFIPNYNEAENLMLNRAAIPRYTSKAYTKEGVVMFPITSKGGYRSYTNDRLRHYFSKNDSNIVEDIKKDLEMKKMELKSAHDHYKRQLSVHETQKKELDNNSNELKRIVIEIRKKEDELLELKTAMALETEEPIEITIYEEEISNLVKLSEAEMLKMEGYNKRLDEITSEIKNLSQQCQDFRTSIEHAETKAREISKIINDLQDSMNVAREFIRESQASIKKKSDLVDSLNNQTKETIEAIERHRAANPSQQPKMIPPTVEVEAELTTARNYQQVELDNMQDPAVLMQNLKKRMSEIESFKEQRELNISNTDSMKLALEERVRGFKSLREATFSKVSTSFSSIMKTMNMTGELDISHDDVIVNGQVIRKARTLHINVDTHSDDLSPQSKRQKTTQNNRKETEATLDTRSLSGGERSFSTVAFVLALWHHCVSPFKLMDEIDVFMDMVTRRQSYNALISFANISTDPGQFIFFSPLGLPKISNPESIKVFTMPEIVRKND